VSSLSSLRSELVKQERRLRYARESQDPRSAYQRTKRKIANLYAALAREESRLFNPATKL
jgi:hypothetical protein